jgi:hypothetical protein
LIVIKKGGVRFSESNSAEEFDSIAGLLNTPGLTCLWTKMDFCEWLFITVAWIKEFEI